MSLMDGRQSQCHDTLPSLYTFPPSTIINRPACSKKKTIIIAYTYLSLCRPSAIEEAIVQPLATTRACHIPSCRKPKAPRRRDYDAKQQTVMFRCHSMMVLGKPVLPWAALRTSFRLAGECRVPLTANPQAGSVKMRTCTSGSTSRWSM